MIKFLWDAVRRSAFAKVQIVAWTGVLCVNVGASLLGHHHRLSGAIVSFTGVALLLAAIIGLWVWISRAQREWERDRERLFLVVDRVQRVNLTKEDDHG